MKNIIKSLPLFLLVTLLIGAKAGVVSAGIPEKVTICHAAGQQDTAHFVQITAAYNAIYGRAGHFSEPGSPNAGHENDYEGPCEEVIVDYCFNIDGIQDGIPEGYLLDDAGACVSDEPVYGCADEVAINYNSEATQDDESCEYEKEVLVEKNSSIWLGNPACDGKFTVYAKYEQDNQSVEGLSVELSYKTQHIYLTTDVNGEVNGTFDYKGNDADAFSKATGFETKSTAPRVSDSCKSSDEEKEIGGLVLGVSTETPSAGQVLGASTMAETGTEDAFALLFVVSVFMISYGLKPYAIKKA